MKDNDYILNDLLIIVLIWLFAMKGKEHLQILLFSFIQFINLKVNFDFQRRQVIFTINFVIHVTLFKDFQINQLLG